MSLPMVRKIHLLEFKSRNKPNIDINELDESLHVFNNQYQISELLTGLVVECLKINKDECTVDISRYGTPLKNVHIIIKKINSLIYNIGARLSNLDDEGNIEFTITLNKLQTLDDNINKQIFSQIKNAIAH